VARLTPRPEASLSPNPPAGSQTDNQLLHDPRQRRGILIAVCLALMAVIASVSGLNVAQPQLALALAASQGQVLWMINLYTITMAALLLPLGAVGDRWGRKPVLIAGLVLFGLASAAAGLATSTGIMLAARLLSGVGAAMIMPATLAIMTATFPAEARSRAIGAWTAVAGGGGVLGMFGSAVLVDAASWRCLFILPVGLVLAALPMALRAIPNARQAPGSPFDRVGALTSLGAVVGCILVLHEGPEHGWTAPATLLSLLVGVGSATGFVLWERHQQAPLLDVRLFRHRGLASGSVALLAVFGVPTGIFVVLYPYLQAVLGWSGLAATLALMPMPVLMVGCSALAPRLAARIGVGPTLAIGIFLGGAGLALMAALVSVDGGYLSVLPGYGVMGLGMGLAMTPATEAITAALPRERQGIASALNDVAREFGSALGVALLGAVFAAGYRDAIDARLAGVPVAAAGTARMGIASARAFAHTADPSAMALFRSAQEAFVLGWRQAMWAGVLVMAIVLVYLLVGGPRNREESRRPDVRPSPAPGPDPVFPAQDQVLRLGFREVAGQHAAEKEDLGHGDAHLPDRGAEFPGHLRIGGEGTQAVQLHQGAVPCPVAADGVLLRVVGAPVQGHPALAGVAAGQLVLAEGVDQVQLGADAQGVRPLPIVVVAGPRRPVLAQHAAMVGGAQPEAAFNPALEHRARTAVAVVAPAPQEPQVVVPGLPRGDGGVVLAELEADRHVGGEGRHPLPGLRQGVQQQEQGRLVLAHPGQFHRGRILLEPARGQGLGGHAAGMFG